MTSLRAILSLVFVLILASCDQQRIEYSNNRAAARWSENAPANYTYKYIIECFCFGPAMGGASVTVKSGEITEIQFRERLATPEEIQSFQTIGDLFGEIERRNTGKVHRILSSYNSVYGYPTQFSVDPTEDIADDTWGFRIVEFSNLDSE